MPPERGRLMRPRIRPADIQQTVQRVAYTPEQSHARSTAAATFPPEHALPSLAPLTAPRMARAEWDTHSGQIRPDDLTANRGLYQEVQSGGRTFYRLRAMGFVILSDTRRFCSAWSRPRVSTMHFPVQVK